MANMQDLSAEAAVNQLADLIRLSSFLPGSLGSFSAFYNAVSPEMPSDLKSTSVTSPVPPAPVYRFNYDEGHAGRFSVPATDGASLDPNWVLEQSDPLAYIANNLAFHDKATPEAPVHSTLTRAPDFEIPQPDTDSAPQPDDKSVEVAIFIPGLNTVHEPMEGETTTVDRLIHYVRILHIIPMAQLHLGTSFDQGNLSVDAGASPLFRAVMSSPAVPASLKGVAQGAALNWDARQLDRLQAALSKFNVVDTPVKRAVRHLLALLPDASQHLVLLAYSRGSIEVEAALRGWISEAEESGRDLEDIETELRKLTVVTVGSATNNFPDGPAYVHLSAWNDPLANTSGVQAGKRSSGAGRDAVFLNCSSPYNAEAFDNHNFGALTAQYAALVMAASGATGWRDLWEKARNDEMVIPDEVDQLTRAMVQITRGYEWLWSPDAAWRDIPMGALPEPDEAISMLREHIGDKFVDDVRINFP